MANTESVGYSGCKDEAGMEFRSDDGEIVERRRVDRILNIQRHWLG